MRGFDRLHPAVRHHIVNSLEWTSLRPLQQAAIDPILDGENVLLLAPTAGGKTEAAFFPVLSEILSSDLGPVSVLYVCPLRALLNNLEQRLAAYCSLVGRSARLWHGDITQADKAQTLREPPDVLLTTPESIEAMLISTRVNRAALFGRVRFVICDELHAFAGDDRGWHLRAVLARAAPHAQRIGLSATVGEPESLLAWFAPEPRRVVAPFVGTAEADVTLDYVGSIENSAAVIGQLHRGEKRLVFTDSRSQAEQLAAHLFGRGVETFVSHSSLSRDERLRAESAFTEAKNCVIVATSTLELGIDVGDLDRVIQIDAPSTVASFLQRLGRTGRRSASLRNCLFLATTRESLLRAAAIELLWREGWVEPIVPPDYPVHVTVQQILVLLLEHRTMTEQKLLAQIGDSLPHAAQVLAHMRESGFVSSDGPMLMIGPEAERLWGRRNYMELLSVFDTPELFNVRCGLSELGSVHELSLRMRDDQPAVLLLTGRAWRVRSVDWDRHLVQVEPAEEYGRSTWLGSSRPLSFEICQAMRRVLLANEANSSWSRRAAKELSLFRAEPIVDDVGTVLLETKSGSEWWTFAGLRGNAALTYSWPFPVSYDNLSIRARASQFEVRKAIETQREIPAPQPDGRTLPKFAECLPVDLLTSFAWKRNYDEHAATAIRSQSVIDATRR